MFNLTETLSDNKSQNLNGLRQKGADENVTDTSGNSVFTVPGLLNLLNQSPCVTWILDVRTQKFSFISTNTFDFFGYHSINYMMKGHSFHEETKHPEDLLNTRELLFQILKIMASIPSFNKANYKFSFDYRITKADGKTVRILEQNSVLQQDEDGNVTHLLGVCNDITQWKRSGAQLALLSSQKDKQFFLFTSENIKNIKLKSILSKRELEIVKLISEGHSSKYIADKLFISFHTVNTHRQKIIEKTNSKNTSELVQFAICNGLI